MINTQTLARPYAKAAFEFARAAGKADAWSAMLNLAAVAVEVPEVEALLKDPRLTSESKVQSVVRLFGSDIDEAFRNFVLTMGENDRLDVLPTVRELYEELKADAEKTLEAQVETAFELGTEQLNTLAAALFQAARSHRQPPAGSQSCADRWCGNPRRRRGCRRFGPRQTEPVGRIVEILI